MVYRVLGFVVAMTLRCDSIMHNKKIGAYGPARSGCGKFQKREGLRGHPTGIEFLELGGAAVPGPETPVTVCKVSEATGTSVAS